LWKRAFRTEQEKGRDWYEKEPEDLNYCDSSENDRIMIATIGMKSGWNVMKKEAFKVQNP